ncbi:MAG: GtrA family protein [Lachnospiraceae bacterium]|nr:GtrA family protein [Lachnospiraceae bacterium]
MKINQIFFEKTNNTLIQFFRSLFVGGIATVVDFAATALVRELIFNGKDSWQLRLLYVSCGFIAGLICNFILSCLFVFGKSEKTRQEEFLTFAVIGIMGLLLNYGIISFCSLFISMEGLVFYIVKLFATLVTFIWNFFARKIIIYTPKNNKQTN